MKKQFFVLFLLLCIFHTLPSFSQSIQNLIDYPNQINAVSVFDSNTIWVLTSTGEVLKTDYLFTNFDVVSKNNRFGFDIKFYDADVGCCLGYADTIFRTTDAGKNWNGTIINKKNHCLYTLTSSVFINKDEILIGCTRFNNVVNNRIDFNNYNGVIIKITGNDISEVYSNPKSTINKIYSINDVYYAVGNNNYILRSYDHGSTWTSLASKNEWSVNDVFFLNDNTGYFVGSNINEGFLSITYDGCKTWIYKEIPRSKNLRAIYAVNKDSVIILGNESKLYCTVNGCETFHKIEFSENANIDLYCINKLDSKNLFFFATRKIENEDKEIISSNTSIDKILTDKFFRDYKVILTPEKYKKELLEYINTEAENEAFSLHPASKIEKITKNKVKEALEENKYLSEEYIYTIDMKGSLLGINEFLVKLKIIGKTEFDVLGHIKFVKEVKIIEDKKK